jgi:hypothetical protein
VHHSTYDSALTTTMHSRGIEWTPDNALTTTSTALHCTALHCTALHCTALILLALHRTCDTGNPLCNLPPPANACPCIACCPCMLAVELFLLPNPPYEPAWVSSPAPPTVRDCSWAWAYYYSVWGIVYEYRDCSWAWACAWRDEYSVV